MANSIRLLASLAVLTAGSVHAAETTVFRSVGEHGEAVFSDEPSDNHESLVIEADAPHDPEERRRQSAEELRMATILQRSRHARERNALANRRAARKAAPPQPRVVERRSSPYWWPYRARKPYRPARKRDREPRVEQHSRAIRGPDS